MSQRDYQLSLIESTANFFFNIIIYQIRQPYIMALYVRKTILYTQNMY